MALDQRPSFWSYIFQHRLGEVPCHHLLAISGRWCSTGSICSWAVHWVLFLPVVCRRNEEEVLLYGGRAFLQVRFSLRVWAEFYPVDPFSGLQPFIHCCSRNLVPCRIEVMSNVVSGVRCTCLQYCCCGKSKVVEKWERNKVSVTRFLPNLWDVTPAIKFSTP